jgi:GNAT superfamily N-acetyltransferase
VTVEVREVADDEAEAAGELVVAAYAALEDGPDAGEHGYADELRAVGERSRQAVVLVAVDDGRLVGCVTFVPDSASPLAEDLRPGEAGVRMLAVDPAWHRRGVGRALVAACIERARAAGQHTLFLHSGTWMSVAHRLYESMGFQRVPERDWVPVPGIPLLAFALDLGGAVEGGAGVGR